jgi:uncharacterized protein
LSSTLQLLGRGWRFPVRPDVREGGLDYVGGPEAVRQSIFLILETEPGERIMRPRFGCGLQRFLMNPNTAATRALIRHDIQRTLSTQEPRIRLDNVIVDPGEDPALVLIHIAYVHLRTGRKDNLVYPFYLE